MGTFSRMRNGIWKKKFPESNLIIMRTLYQSYIYLWILKTKLTKFQNILFIARIFLVSTLWATFFFVHFLANSALLPFGQPQNGPGGLGQDIFSKYLQANTLGEWHWGYVGTTLLELLIKTSAAKKGGTKN